MGDVTEAQIDSLTVQAERQLAEMIHARICEHGLEECLEYGGTHCTRAAAHLVELGVRPPAEVAELRARVAELEAQNRIVRAHIDQRPEYVTALENCNGNADHDYYRWSGGAEARRQLAEKLGWTVPYRVGEVTGPKPATALEAGRGD